MLLTKKISQFSKDRQFDIGLRFISLRGITLLLLSSFLHPFSSTAQTTGSDEIIKLSFAQQTHSDILAKMEEELDLSFNYNQEILSLEEYTFSSEGNKKDILSRISAIINLEFTYAEDGVYIISKRPEQNERHTPLTIAGLVHDEQASAMPYSYVSIPSLKVKTITDAEGYFSLTAYASPSDTILIEHLGYKKMEMSVAQFLENADPQNIYLTIEEHQLSDVIIIGKKRNAPSEPEKLNTSDDKLPSSSADNDVLQLANSVAGVYAPSESLSELLIRGGSPDHVKYKWNGIQIIQNSHFYGKVSSINPYMVDQIQITKNGASADASGQVSGSIEFGNQAEADKTEVFLHSNLLYTNIGTNVSTKDKKLNLKLSARSSYPKNWSSPLYNNYANQTFQFGKVTNDDFIYELYDIEEFIINESNINFRDLSGSLSYQIDSKHQIKADYINITNNLEYEIDNTFNDTTSLDQLVQTNRGISLSSEHHWNALLHTEVNYSQSDYVYDYQYLPEINTAIYIGRVQQNELAQSLISINQKIRSNWIELSLGYQLEKWNSVVFDTDLSIENMIPYTDIKSIAQEHSAHINLTLIPNEITKLEGGLRWSNFDKSLNGRKILEPRLHFSLIPTEKVRVHAHYGEYHQSLNRINTYTPFQVDNGFWYLSDERDSPNFIWLVKSRQQSIGISFGDPTININATYYTKDIFDLWTAVLDFSIDENPYRFANVSIKGIELSSNINYKKLRSRITYDYIDEEMFIPEENISLPSPYSQPHRFAIYNTLQLDKVTLGLQWQYATGRPFSTPTSFTSELNDIGETKYRINFEELLSEQVDDYHSLNISVSYSFSLFNRRDNKGLVGLQVTNLYNRANVLKNQYFINYNTDPIEQGLLEKKGLPTTANLFVQYTF